MIDDDSVWDAYHTLLLGPDTSRLRKLLARTTIFRRALRAPGDIVECGVFKGTGLLTWLKLLEIYDHGSARRVVGFDAFTHFPAAGYDAELIASFVQESRFEGVSPDDLYEVVAEAGIPSDRCELVGGDIGETAPDYVRRRPGFRIALLHMDLDLGAPTLAALDAMWPRVARGGVVLFDEYAITEMSESEGVDTFFASRHVRLHPMPHAFTPTAYLIKP